MTIYYRCDAVCKLFPIRSKTLVTIWSHSVDGMISTEFSWFLILILIQAIDLDQIVSEHYERSCSQQTTQVTNRIVTATPPSVQSKVRGAPVGACNAESADSSLKTCVHGVQVGSVLNPLNNLMIGN